MIVQLHCGRCKSPHPDVKSSLFAQSNIFLGVETDFANFAQLWEIRMRVPIEKCARTAHSIASALLERELTPMAAAKIRGWLQFFLTWSFGRLGRAALQPISDRQYRDDGRFTPALEAALRFLQHVLQSIPACAFQAYASTKRPKKRAVLVWSDAAYEKDSPTPGTLGFVIFVPTEPSASNPNPSHRDGVFYHASAETHPRVMARFRPKKQYIGQLEILAAVCVYYSWPELFVDRDVIHWIDNSSAIMALIKGYSGMPDSARLVHAYYLMMYKLGTRVWFEHVVSDANVSDMPSRGDFRYLLEELHSSPITLVIPPFEVWDEPFDSRSWSHFITPRGDRKRRHSL